MPIVSVITNVVISVRCSCGEDLSDQVDSGNGIMYVKPCKRCLFEADAIGRSKGYEDKTLNENEMAYRPLPQPEINPR